MQHEYILYGSPVSYYTAKARTYLIYKQCPYKEVFSSLDVYKKIIVPKTGVRFIPVLQTPEGEYLQDSSVIIDTLEARLEQRPVIPQTPKHKLISYLFEIWADEWLLLPAMHYRWNKDNFPFIYQEFGKVVWPKMPAFLRAIVGRRLAARFKGFLPILGITDKTIPAIEQWYEDHVLFHLNEHFSQHDYLLGGAPTLGDFALMGPLYAHLYRDPAPGKIMRQKAPYLVSWIKRMNKPLASPAPLLAEDAIADTLMPLLTRMFTEFWPVLLNTNLALEKWFIEHPGQQRIPRSLGEHTFKIGGSSGERGILSFQQWKLQRLLACYDGFNADEKNALGEILNALGGTHMMGQTLSRKVHRVNNRLEFA
jgi:glutathione S-transferase